MVENPLLGGWHDGWKTHTILVSVRLIPRVQLRTRGTTGKRVRAMHDLG